MNVEVNVRAIIQRILSRYPSQFAMFREMIQNANDAGASKISFAFKNNCGDDKWSFDYKDRPCLVVNDNGDGFQQEGWKRLVTIASMSACFLQNNDQLM